MQKTILSSLEECVGKRSHGEGVGGKCRKDKAHDLGYRFGSPAEFRRAYMHSLSPIRHR